MNSLDLPRAPKDTRVVVAMSGGVDSSVVAGILAREGYDVVGVTLQLYDHGAATHRPGSCCAGQDIDDARRVCERLGIPHYVLDYESRFREAVINPFAEAYMAGETPVPCVACNQTVKFEDLLQTARDLGADPLIAFIRVTVPYLRPALIGAGIFCLLLSFDDFVRSFFLGGYDPTLPVLIFTRLHSGMSPEINAIATVALVLTAIVGIWAERSMRRMRKEQNA